VGLAVVCRVGALIGWLPGSVLYELLMSSLDISLNTGLLNDGQNSPDDEQG
jgi:hypothetical protein